MPAWNTINYMQYVATDLLGHAPEEQPRPAWGAPRGSEWLMRAPGRSQELSCHMASFGYTVADRGDDWIAVSGSPTSAEAIRDLEVRQAEKHLEWLRDRATEDHLAALTGRF